MNIDVHSGAYRCCDGITRRSFLKAGSLMLGGLSLSRLLQRQAMAQAAGEKVKDISVILFWQGGGPSQLDMWDLKPDAPSEFRGSFSPINTKLDGLQVSEHMPRIAKIADKMTLIRSATHGDAGHESASHTLLTGYKPTNDIPANEAPAYGSIVAKEMGPRVDGFPAYITVPTAPKSSAAAYLGVAYNPFETQGDPNTDNFDVRNLKVPGGLTLDRLENRRNILAHFDTLRRDIDSSGLISGMDTFSQQAYNIVTSPKVQAAFDISKEDPKTRDLYGRTTWGQNTLLARRLIESGVRFVTVNVGGWDTHANNFEALKNQKLPQFDQAFAGLIEDLDQRGQLDSTLVMSWGEFGRTPRINKDAGRDHWPNVFSVAMAGGGLKRGFVLGESDARAEFPKERPVSPQDILSTMYAQLGIDQTKAYVNEADRPVPILSYGEPIREIIA
ncbi:MAG TPA: DUF1501 domain-containing protein [Chthoniobacteraceae bacterium]|jgi:hypothetical protein|nr:DUF1501 domain-containing protein [Chthoniobacteraceae bacterium]